MTDLRVFFEQRRVGTIDIDRAGPGFAYDPEWIRLRGAFPISTTMPLKPERIASDIFLPWAANLLPESEQLRTLGQLLGMAAGDVVGLLSAIGGDTAGALSIGQPGRTASVQWLVSFVIVRPVLGWTSNWAPLIEAAVGTAIVAFLSFGRVGAPGRAFDLGVARFFGRVSYSFYLLHPLTLIVMWNMPETLGAIIRFGVPVSIVALALFILSTAAVTPLAWGMFQWVERPGVVLGRALAKRLAAHCYYHRHRERMLTL